MQQCHKIEGRNKWTSGVPPYVYTEAQVVASTKVEREFSRGSLGVLLLVVARGVESPLLLLAGSRK